MKYYPKDPMEMHLKTYLKFFEFKLKVDSNDSGCRIIFFL